MPKIIFDISSTFEQILFLQLSIVDHLLIQTMGVSWVRRRPFLTCFDLNATKGSHFMDLMNENAKPMESGVDTTRFVKVTKTDWAGQKIDDLYLSHHLFKFGSKSSKLNNQNNTHSF